MEDPLVGVDSEEVVFKEDELWSLNQVAGSSVFPGLAKNSPSQTSGFLARSSAVIIKSDFDTLVISGIRQINHRS